MDLRTVLVRLDSSSQEMQSELNIRDERTVSQLLRTAEQVTVQQCAPTAAVDGWSAAL